MKQGNVDCAVAKCPVCEQSHALTSLQTGNGIEEIVVCPNTDEVIARMDVNADNPFNISVRYYPEEQTVRKTEFKYYIEECPSCGDRHEGYRGKLNAEDEEYVVCGNTHKKMLTAAHPEWTRMRVEGVSEPKEVPSKKPSGMTEEVENLIASLPNGERPDVPYFNAVLEECERYEYPKEMIQRHGGIPTNTEYSYVSNSFLDGLVNSVGVKVGYMLNRYGLAHLETDEVYASYRGLIKNINKKVHCTGFGHDDCVLLGDTPFDYWLFWYDKDVSDCIITRIDKAAYASFEDFRLSVLEYLIESYDNWAHSTAPSPELYEFKPKGWISWS